MSCPKCNTKRRICSNKCNNFTKKCICYYDFDMQRFDERIKFDLHPMKLWNSCIVQKR